MTGVAVGVSVGVSVAAAVLAALLLVRPPARVVIDPSPVLAGRWMPAALVGAGALVALAAPQAGALAAQ